MLSNILFRIVRGGLFGLIAALITVTMYQIKKRQEQINAADRVLNQS